MKSVLSCGSLFDEESSAICPDNSLEAHEMWSPRRFKSQVVRKLQTERYRRERKLFKNEGLTYQRQLLIWHLAQQFSMKNRSLFKVYRLFVKIANTLMMNSLEITHWSMQLTELSPTDQATNPRRLLLFTGFTSKLYFNTDVRHLELRCCKLIPAFPHKFRQWLLMTDCEYDLPLRKLNLIYTELYSGRVSSHKLSTRPVKRQRRGTDMSTEEDMEAQMCRDMMVFEEETMKGEKLSPLDLYNC
mmetsp:Transcript_17314/g.31200  ORF Transcript_17314/g.31200 Transcript_17314/m.31200 type:complete len:244 (+) Transcript_17314:2205-2936(+)